MRLKFCFQIFLSYNGTIIGGDEIICLTIMPLLCVFLGPIVCSFKKHFYKTKQDIHSAGTVFPNQGSRELLPPEYPQDVWATPFLLVDGVLIGCTTCARLTLSLATF